MYMYYIFFLRKCMSHMTIMQRETDEDEKNFELKLLLVSTKFRVCDKQNKAN